jgi:hypothetical protein
VDKHEPENVANIDPMGMEEYRYMVQRPKAFLQHDVDNGLNALGNRNFSLILLDNSLEHFDTPPDEVLRDVHALANKHAEVVVRVPHRDSPDACQVNHRWLFDEHSLKPLTRETNGLDSGALFHVKDVRVKHRHPFAWHQREHLDREVMAWGKQGVEWRLEALP